jgi:hypothetical protein
MTISHDPASLPAPAPLAPRRRLTDLLRTLAPDAPPATWLLALHERLQASLREYRRRRRDEPGIWRTAVPHSEVRALNADLALVRRINEVLPHHRRSATIAAWPQPVIPETVLLAPPDLYPALERATGLLGAAIAQLALEIIDAL